MEHRKNSFTGFWCVVQTESNIAGEWRHNHDFEPHEWNICMFDDGYYSEVYRYPVEGYTGKWSLDENGIISIEYDLGHGGKCVFREKDGGCYLYNYEDRDHIVPDPELIIEHHAISRYRLEKLDPAEIKYLISGNGPAGMPPAKDS